MVRAARQHLGDERAAGREHVAREISRRLDQPHRAQMIGLLVADRIGRHVRQHQIGLAAQFLRQTIQGDNSEIQLGQLAESQGASQGVKDFGRTLEQDHAQARDQAAQVAKQVGVTPPQTMMPEAKQEKAKLSRLHGAAFDREFARYMVDDHKKDIRKFEQQAAGRGPTAQLARQTLPTLKKHLKMAESLAGKG